MNYSIPSRAVGTVLRSALNFRVQGSGFRTRRRSTHPQWHNFLNQNPEPRTLNPRHGVSVIEVSMALLILSFAVGGLLQILAVAASQRRTSEVRRLALQEVANQAEHIVLLPWGELTGDKLAERKPSDELLAAAPTSTLKVTQVEEAGPPTAKRIHLAVQWTTPAGDTVQPVQLNVWRHQPTEARP